jgi:hypothetical protein
MPAAHCSSVGVLGEVPGRARGASFVERQPAVGSPRNPLAGRDALPAFRAPAEGARGHNRPTGRFGERVRDDTSEIGDVKAPAAQLAGQSLVAAMAVIVRAAAQAQKPGECSGYSR